MLELQYQNDKEFADALCKKKKDAMSEFQDLYCDELYFISSKFCNRGIEQDAWQYRVKKGYTINVNDDVSDTYVWLMKHIVLNKSCHYKGVDGASFEAYIKTVLNSEFVFIGWLRWKTDDSLIKIPGAAGYVPKCIQSLDDNTIEVFKLLRQKKSDQSICKKLDIEYLDYLSIYNIIEEKLLETNQIHLINRPRISTTDGGQDEDEGYDLQLTGEIEISPERFPEFELLQSMIETILNDIDEAGRKILILWAAGYSSNEIMDELNSRSFYKGLKEDQKINEVKNIYPYIEKQITYSVKTCEQKFSEYYDTYKIDNSKMKRLLKTYFQNFN